MRQHYHECPQCGHERVQRRTLTLRGETGAVKARVRQWLCGLCSYAWVAPLPTPEKEDWIRA